MLPLAGTSDCPVGVFEPEPDSLGFGLSLFAPSFEPLGPTDGSCGVFESGVFESVGGVVPVGGVVLVGGVDVSGTGLGVPDSVSVGVGDLVPSVGASVSSLGDGELESDGDGECVP